MIVYCPIFKESGGCMKIELMKLLSHNIKDIELLKNLIKILELYSNDDLNLIINILKECNFNEDVCRIFAECYDDTINLNDKIELIKEFKKYNYNKYEYQIIMDAQMFDNMSLDEKIKLIKLSNKSGSNKFAYYKIKFMEILDECNYNEYVYKIIC